MAGARGVVKWAGVRSRCSERAHPRLIGAGRRHPADAGAASEINAPAKPVETPPRRPWTRVRFPPPPPILSPPHAWGYSDRRRSEHPAFGAVNLPRLRTRAARPTPPASPSVEALAARFDQLVLAQAVRLTHVPKDGWETFCLPCRWPGASHPRRLLA